MRAAESDPRRVADLVNLSSVAGRRVGVGGGVYQLTKHGVGAFSESLRQEVTSATCACRWWSWARPEIRDQLMSGRADEPLQAPDIADAIAYVVTRPRHVAINEVLVRPTEQVR